MHAQLRQLFVDICSDKKLTVEKQLCNKYWIHISEDYIRNEHDKEISKNLALKLIQNELRKRCVNMEEAHGLSAINFVLHLKNTILKHDWSDMHHHYYRRNNNDV